MKALIISIFISLFLVGCQSTPNQVMITPDMVINLGPMPEWTQQVEKNDKTKTVVAKTKKKYFVEMFLLEIVYIADTECKDKKCYTKIMDEFDCAKLMDHLDAGDLCNIPLECVDLNVLSAPDVCLDEGEVACVNVCQRYPYLNEKDKVSAIDIGIKHYIRIKNNADNKTFDSDICTEICEIDRCEKDQQGNLKPIIEMERIGSSVNTPAGQTIIFGGVVRNCHKSCKVKIPYISSIPFLGKVCTYNKVKPVKKELILIVKPKLLDQVAAN